MSTEPQEVRAVVPIAEALPELREEIYADVCAWDAARMELRSGYEAADGAFLAQIQEKLAPAGLWHAYLKARKIAPSTAYDRIAKAQGHPNKRAAVSGTGDARQLSETTALLTAARAELVTVNHELAASHEAIQRLKRRASPDYKSKYPLAEMEQMWENMQQLKRPHGYTPDGKVNQWDEEMVARAERAAQEHAAARRAAERAQTRTANAQTPEGRERNKQEDEKHWASRVKAEATWRREQYLKATEMYVETLLKVPSDEEIALLTDEQRQRYGELARALAAIAKWYVKKLGVEPS